MELLETISTRINYWIYIVLMMIGLYAMISKNNLIKKLIGMSIFQTAIILFYVSIGVKEGATIPILDHDQVHAAQAEHGEGAEALHEFQPGEEIVPAAERAHDEPVISDVESPEIDPDHFTNPLPHVLMLTAIVVGVSTLGVALSITQKLYTEFGTIEENEILDQIKSGHV